MNLLFTYFCTSLITKDAITTHTHTHTLRKHGTYKMNERAENYVIDIIICSNSNCIASSQMSSIMDNGQKAQQS